MHRPLPLNLALFGQAAESAPPPSGQSAQPGESAQPGLPDQPATPDQGPEPARTQRAQAQDARKSFDQLIQGEYKEEYQRRLKAQLDRRFKAYEERKRAQDQLLSTLARRYGLPGEDPQTLARALGEQRRTQEKPRGADAPAPGEQPDPVQSRAQNGTAGEPAPDQADNRGEAAQGAGPDPQALAQLRAQGIYRDWQRQAAAARQVYPGLDLAREMTHPRFRQLMRAGLGVREAYEVVHRDQVLGGAMAYAARAMARKVGNALAAQGARPRESGAGDNPASRPARPEEFTDQQVLEVARQARKGRRITLN